MKIGAILMMAGNGSRMKIDENKVYLPLGNKLIYEYSLQLFLKMGLEVVCVVREKDIPFLKQYEGKIIITIGGATRQESVIKGLLASNCDAVIIHDAARPFITFEIMEKCIQALNKKNAFMVVTPCKDSIYELEPIKSLNRSNLTSAQTPQGGLRNELLKCHKQAKNDNILVTDDASVILKYGDSVLELIEGQDTNFKITTQLDYIIAKELIKGV